MSSYNNPSISQYNDNKLYHFLKKCMIFFVVLLLLFFIFFPFDVPHRHPHSFFANSSFAPLPKPTHISYKGRTSVSLKSTTRLKDYNKAHLRHAQANGINHPFKDSRQLEKTINTYLNKGDLVNVHATRYYMIRPLNYSHAYLTPAAISLLNEIGIRFQNRLKEKNLPLYRYELSSILRTVEDQKKLTRVNRNATPNASSHYYGATFDICYRRFFYDGEHSDNVKAMYCLIDVIKELRKECRLLCVDEKNNACFHITTTMLNPRG